MADSAVLLALPDVPFPLRSCSCAPCIISAIALNTLPFPGLLLTREHDGLETQPATFPAELCDSVVWMTAAYRTVEGGRVERLKR